MKTEILQALESSPLFAGLPGGLLEKIAGSVTRKKLAAGELLFQQGDHADALWGVLSGRIVVEVRADDGKEMVVDSYEPGDIFGEVGVLDFGPRRVDAAAQTNAELFRLDRSQFLEFLQSNPELCFRIFTLLCTHLRTTTGTLEDTALYKLSGRLAKRLLNLAVEEATDDGDEVLHISQVELARLLGVNREAVNRQLREWERSGWIALGREKVEIIDRQSLADLAAPTPQSAPKTWELDMLSGTHAAVFSDVTPAADADSLKKHRSAVVLAVDCSTYSSLLKVDSARAIKRLKKDLAAIDRSIELNGGRVIWSVGERTIAEFATTRNAVEAALQIHRATGGTRRGETPGADSFCRLGIHAGEFQVSEGRVFGEPISVAIELTKMLASDGICFTAALLESFTHSESVTFHSLGKLRLKGVGRTLEVYSVKPFPVLVRLKLKAEDIIPRRYRPVMAVFGLLLAMTLVWFSGRVFNESPPFLTGSPDPSIAVLPFRFDGDIAYAWTVSGLEDSIRQDLANMPRLLVVGRQSSHYFKGRENSVQEIGKILKVNFVLLGYAEILQDRSEITIRLVSAAGGEEVWRHVHQGSARDFDRIRLAVARGVGQELIGEDVSERVRALPSNAPDNEEARSLYLMARHQLSHTHGKEHVKALRLLEAAVILAPEFANAWSLLSSLYESEALDVLPEFDPDIRMALHKEAWEKAVVLAPDSADVLSGMAYRALRNGELETASELANRAAAAYPNEPVVLNTLWGILVAQDNWAAAMDVSEEMLDLDPLNVYFMARHVSPRWAIGQCDEVLALAEKVLVIYPGNVTANIWLATCLGDPVSAIEASVRTWPYGAPLALWYGLDEIGQDVTNIHPRHAANFHAYMANYDSARDALEEAFPRGRGDTFPQLNWEYLVARGELEALDGEYGQAIIFFEQALSLDPVGRGDLAFEVTLRQWISSYRQSTSALALLHAYRKSGMTAKADRISRLIQEGLESRRQGLARVGAVDIRTIQNYAEAQFLAIEGRPGEAIETLAYVKRDPLLESLHREPRFLEIVADVEARLADIRFQYRSRNSNGAEPP
jgi:CRP-like cAMP-binding protein/class 3 adenylate cyclase/TolB-like protein